jgi:hypothetical protein
MRSFVRYLTYFLAGLAGFLLLSLGLIASQQPATAYQSAASQPTVALVQSESDAVARSHQEANFYQ